MTTVMSTKGQLVVPATSALAATMRRRKSSLKDLIDLSSCHRSLPTYPFAFF
jgi:hypothetical protein